MQKLYRRSKGERESAAIWSGRISGEFLETVRIDFHHEICDDHATALSLELSEAAKFNLYQNLARKGLKLLAMIHTHPDDWVDLSLIDRRNQLCSRIGFWSIVVPNYARPPWNIHEMGFHLRTEYGWYQLTPDETDRMILFKESI